jgi:hypothetical protein
VSQKLGSPKRSNISGIVWSAARSISTSESTKPMFSRFASRRPIVDLPAPMRPTSTIDLPEEIIGQGIGWGYT